MANLVKIAATIGGVLLMLGALVTLSMEQYIASGTLFMFTAFAIYIREMHK
jgi:hypothetical protein